MKALWDKIKNWLNTNNHLIWIATIALIALGLLGVYFIGPYQATRLKLGPDIFFNKYWPVALIGTVIIFAFSNLSQKWIIRISWLLGIFSTLLIFKTWLMPTVIHGSVRFVTLGSMYIDPFTMMLPAYIVLMSHWLSKEHKNKNLVTFCISAFTLFIVWFAFRAPYAFMSGIYVLLFFMLTFKARKNNSAAFKMGLIILTAFIAAMVLSIWQYPHMYKVGFSQIVGSQAWFAVEAIRHSTLIGNTPESLRALSFLPESYTDFMLTGMIARFGILMGLLIIALYGCLAKGLTGIIHNSNDNFYKLLATGTLGLLAILIISVLAVTSGLLYTWEYLPLVSFNSVAFLAWSILLGFILAVNRN